MSEAAATTFAFEQLEPSAPPPRDTAARVLAQARAEAEEILAAARAQGYEEGMTAGRRDAAAEVTRTLDALQEAVAAVEACREQTAEAVERDAIELALALAGKIVAGSLEARPELIVDVMQGALRRITDRRRISVLVNPADLDSVQATVAELAGPASGIERCELQGDARVSPGGVIVRTTEGEVDASVQTQLRRAQELILHELGAPPSGA